MKCWLFLFTFSNLKLQNTTNLQSGIRRVALEGHTYAIFAFMFQAGWESRFAAPLAEPSAGAALTESQRT